jgi:hypothetical protein
MKIGLIVEANSVARWQANALETLSDEAEFVIYNCANGAPSVRRLRHAAYYLLNLFTIRNRLTRRTSIPAALKIVETRVFEASCEGSWQSLPPDLIAQVGRDSPDVLLKFGMGLLRVPPSDVLPVPILSYHHGDPTRFRGRPAGFYELAAGEETMGQIVQVLSNELDAGNIAAQAETSVVSYSYRATLIEAYRHSPLLLRTAILNVLAGRTIGSAQHGPAYRLPSNMAVMRFMAGRFFKALQRLIYGITVEKEWRVATTALSGPPTLRLLEAHLTNDRDWSSVPIPAGFAFLADPFFHPEGGLLVEGMNDRSSCGEILRVTTEGCRRVSGCGGHFSYPSVVTMDGRDYVLPEVSDWSSALAFPLNSNGFGEAFELKFSRGGRLLDPTPFRQDDQLFLFGNDAEEGSSVLRLWMSAALDGEFVEHPSSPIRISPRGSRMAGSLTEIDGQLYRIGQDLRRNYGDGVSFFRILRITPEEYEEDLVSEFRFSQARGPHTISLSSGQIAFDYYQDRLSLLAGFRRLKHRRSARRIGRAVETTCVA